VEPLKIVAATPPVEATIRILLNSVPYLIGAAVVRQPPGPDAVAADVGRNPWLFDRRLTSIELPDDALPANRAVALDWPVPFQAEWVGVPPRLLISRLVFAGRTVGVLLGTLITREQLGAQAREAIDLSCELIASAVAMEGTRMAIAPEPRITVPEIATPTHPPRIARPASSSAAGHPVIVEPPGQAAIVDEVSRAVALAGDARAIGRVLRDAMNAVTEAAAFAVALFHADRPEVAYRYKVVGVDVASSEVGRRPVDDGPACDAIRGGRPWHVFERIIPVGSEERPVAVVQVPLRDGGAPIGVVTVQTLRAGGFGQPELELIAAIVDATGAAFAAARAAGRFQPPAEPEVGAPRLRPTTAQSDLPAAAPVDLAVDLPVDGSADAAVEAPAEEEAATARPADLAPADPPAADQTTAQTLSSGGVLDTLLERFASADAPTAFIVGLDVAGGMLRGEGVTGSPAAAELDRALGIADGRFAVSLDDRYNAIARACREARAIAAPTLHEVLQPAYEWSDALALERAVGGGHSTVLPIVVNGSVVGAVIAGPDVEALDAGAVERLEAIVADAARELAAAWRAASIGGPAGQAVAEGERMRLEASREVA